MGAAIHDIGKTIHVNELSESGIRHENIGPTLLLKNGFPEKIARFAHTHGHWEQSTEIEDWLVALCDKIWKGARDKKLERKIAERLAGICDQKTWHVYMNLDEILTVIANDSDARLAWYEKHPV